VIVHDFDLFGLALIPNKANSPLIVNADAVLSGTVAMQGFQAVRGRYAQIIQGLGRVQHIEFFHRYQLNRLR
jgi:hypothetical protein